VSVLKAYNGFFIGGFDETLNGLRVMNISDEVAFVSRPDAGQPVGQQISTLCPLHRSDAAAHTPLPN